MNVFSLVNAIFFPAVYFYHYAFSLKPLFDRLSDFDNLLTREA